MDQSELARAIATQNENLLIVTKSNAGQRDSIEKLKDENAELKARTLEVEQKLVRRSSDGGDGEPYEDDTLQNAFDASDEIKSLLGDRTKRARFMIPGKLLRKATITSVISGGTIGGADRSPTIIAPPQRRLMVRDLLPAVPTTQGSTEFVREVSYTNAAGPQYDGTSPPGPTTEGAVKNASDMTLELVNSPIVTIAHHFTVSRQALDDSVALQQHISTRGIYGWQLELDEELLTGDGTVGTLDGLVNNATAYSRGATGVTPLDILRRAITQLALSDYVATGIVLNPEDAETLELAKDTTGRYMAVVAYVNGQPFVWRLGIVESNTMQEGQFLVGDFGMCATVRDRVEAHVEISLDHADYRTRNLALVLIEGRVGLEIHRPAALVTGSLATL